MKAEYQTLEKIMQSNPHGIQQGTYAVTAGGILLGKIDEGWPIYDSQAAYENMKKAVKKYKTLNKEQRIGKVRYNDKTRSHLRKGYGTAKKGTVELVSTARTYPFEGMKPFDIRHPNYFKIDRLWYSKDEIKELIPRPFKVNEQKEVDKKILERLVRHAHFQVGCAPWNDESIKQSQLTATIVKIKREKVYITLEGKLNLHSQTQWNQSSYKGKLLGRMLYNKQKKQLEIVEWVGLGKHKLAKLAPNIHRGETKKTDVAMFIELDKPHPHEKEITPLGIQNYPAYLKPDAYIDIKW